MKSATNEPRVEYESGPLQNRPCECCSFPVWHEDDIGRFTASNFLESPEKARDFIIKDHHMIAAYAWLLCFAPRSDRSLRTEGTCLAGIYKDVAHLVARKLCEMSHLVSVRAAWLSVSDKKLRHLVSICTFRRPIMFTLMCDQRLRDFFRSRWFDALSAMIPGGHYIARSLWAEKPPCWSCITDDRFFPSDSIDVYDGPKTPRIGAGGPVCCVRCLVTHEGLEVVWRLLTKGHHFLGYSSLVPIPIMETISLYTALVRGRVYVMAPMDQVQRTMQAQSERFGSDLERYFPSIPDARELAWRPEAYNVWQSVGNTSHRRNPRDAARAWKRLSRQHDLESLRQCRDEIKAAHGVFTWHEDDILPNMATRVLQNLPLSVVDSYGHMSFAADSANALEDGGGCGLVPSGAPDSAYRRRTIVGMLWRISQDQQENAAIMDAYARAFQRRRVWEAENPRPDTLAEEEALPPPDPAHKRPRKARQAETSPRSEKKAPRRD